MPPKDLIFEIGAEEIPAGFVPRALSSLEGSLKKGLASRGLAFDAVRTLGTPRRLALIVNGLVDRQPDATVEVRGPQKKAAYDDEGNPTKALLGFALAHNAPIKDIKIKKTDKQEYVFIVKEIKGGETINILPDVLKEILSGEVFPKSMRWGDHDLIFARPVHWLLALYGGSVVELNWGHIKSSAHTFGHRFLDSTARRMTPQGVEGYVEGLRSLCVIADPDERKTIIRNGLESAAKEAGGEVLPDEGLLNEVVYLVEFPVIIRGSFDKEFLSLPRDITINAMREHQRFFTVIDERGSLLPYFLTVANTPTIDHDIVRKGNERVLRARLNDAKFYFEKDVKAKLSERVASLKGVVFQARLGTSYEKVERFALLSLFMGEKTGFSRPLDENETSADFLREDLNPAQFDPEKIDSGLYSKLVLGRTALLCKADLTTGVVGEFPKLQGIMGGIYARMSGEAEEVCLGICEHYLPTQSGGALPASIAGSIVSIADKMDTIAGCFGVGLVPTGAQDPYALRRQALGIIAIIINKGFRISIDAVIDKALGLLDKKLTRNKDEVKKDVLEFFRDRLKFMLLSDGIPFDSIDAVLSTNWHDIIDAIARIKAIEGFKKHPDYAGLTIAFKRVSNILKGVEASGRPPEEALFKEPRETALYEIARRLAPVIEKHRKDGNYEKIFASLASIKDVIDAFFDKVLVMAEDEATRANRLALVNSIRGLYSSTADLSRLN